jgi:hypothetical protein
MTSRSTLCTEGKPTHWLLIELETASSASVDGLPAIPGNDPVRDDMKLNCTGAIVGTSPLHQEKARQNGGRRSGVAKVIRWPMARGVGYSEILNDALFKARQDAVAAIVKAG